MACQCAAHAARLLLDNGAKVDKVDEDGHTPLDAAKYGRHDAVVALIEDHLYKADARDRAVATHGEAGSRALHPGGRTDAARAGWGLACIMSTLWAGLITMAKSSASPRTWPLVAKVKTSQHLTP